MKGKHSTYLVNVPKASTSSISDPDYYNEHGDPVYAHMVSVHCLIHAIDNIHNRCKHLIQFPISTDLEKVRNSVENSNKCSTILLKADTGANMNLMNPKTFDYV